MNLAETDFDADESDNSEMKTYEVSITVPVTIRFEIEARCGDEHDAREVADEEICDWRFAEYIHGYDGRNVATIF